MEQTQNPNFVYLQDFYQLEADYHWTDDYDLTNMGRLIEYITYYHGPYRIYIIACQILRHSCEYILLDLATLLTIRRYSYLYAGTMEIVRVIMANPNLLANVRLGGREHPTIHWNIERLLRANPVLLEQVRELIPELYDYNETRFSCGIARLIMVTNTIRAERDEQFAVSHRIIMNIIALQ